MSGKFIITTKANADMEARSEGEPEGIPIPTPKSFGTEGSADRNKASQQEALRRYLTRGYKVLEIASGFGETISYFASCHPDVMFTPTDPQQPCLDRLKHLTKLHENLTTPMELNIFRQSQWDKVAKNGPFDGILCFNLIHLIPWEGTYTLLKHASLLLEDEHGFLALYGAYLREGQFMSTLDREFDEDIRSRDESWGLRDLETVVRIAGEYGFKKEEIREMRAGNWMVVLRRQ